MQTDVVPALVLAATVAVAGCAAAPVSAAVRGVTGTRTRYIVRLGDFGASNYASGIHGDHWGDVGYVVGETRLVRVPLDGREDPVQASDGTVVVACR